MNDEATATFGAVVRRTLIQPRGWSQAGFTFNFTPTSLYRVVLAEGRDVDRLCAPYRVHSRYSCQNGPVVALNADRWRRATPQWTGTLDEYREMLVNHEVGHLLGQHHPTRACAGPGQPSAVMAQQSKSLRGCAPNARPLPWELACAARHDEPLAPGYDPTVRPRCGPQG